MARIPTAEAAFSSACFGGFLPQPAYFTGGQRRGFTFRLSAMDEKRIGTNLIKKKESLISSALNAEVLRPRAVSILDLSIRDIAFLASVVENCRGSGAT